MTDTATRIEPRYPAITSEVREHRLWFLALGIAMVLLGIAAIAFPFMATLAVELLLGWILLANGALGIVHAFRASRWNGFMLAMLAALLSLGIGILLLLYPLTGILSLTLVIAVFFMAGGLFRILLAFRLRPLDHWGWLLVSGILSLLLAAIILTQWPTAAAWLLGLLVGIDLMFSGWTLLMLGIAAARSG